MVGLRVQKGSRTERSAHSNMNSVLVVTFLSIPEVEIHETALRMGRGDGEVMEIA
jgi:hypothetical protein